MNKFKKILNLKGYIRKKIGSDQAHFLNHSKNYLIGNFATQALSFISIPVFTRLLLPDEYGLIAIVNSITQIFAILMILGFQGALTRNYHEKDGKFSSFFGSITIFLVLYNIIFIAAMYVFRDYFASFFKIDPILFFIAIINGFLGISTSLYLGYLQTAQKSKRFALLSFIRSVVTLGLAIAWVLSLSENRYLGRIYAAVAVNATVMIYSIYNIIKISSFKFKFEKVKYALAYGVPLIPHVMSGFVLAQFDRIIINQLNGAADAGLYSFAYNVGMLMYIFVMSLNRSWVPIFYSKLKENKYEDINKLMHSNSKITLLAALVLIFFSKEIVMIMAAPAYYTAIELVPIIVLSYIFLYYYSLFSNYAFYRKKTILISISTIIAGIVNVALNYIFIPKYGYIAAAYTTLISFILLFILHYMNARFILKEQLPKLRIFFKGILLFAILLTIYYLIKDLEIHFALMIAIKMVLAGIYGGYVLYGWRKRKDGIE